MRQARASPLHRDQNNPEQPRRASLFSRLCDVDTQDVHQDFLKLGRTNMRFGVQPQESFIRPSNQQTMAEIRQDLAFPVRPQPAQADPTDRLNQYCTCLAGDIYAGVARDAFDYLQDRSSLRWFQNPNDYRRFMRLASTLEIINCPGCNRPYLRYRYHKTKIPRKNEKEAIMIEAWRQKEGYFQMIKYIIRKGYYWPSINDEVSVYRNNNSRPSNAKPRQRRIDGSQAIPVRRPPADSRMFAAPHQQFRNNRRSDMEKMYAYRRNQYYFHNPMSSASSDYRESP